MMDELDMLQSANPVTDEQQQNWLKRHPSVAGTTGSRDVPASEPRWRWQVIMPALGVAALVLALGGLRLMVNDSTQSITTGDSLTPSSNMNAGSIDSTRTDSSSDLVSTTIPLSDTFTDSSTPTTADSPIVFPEESATSHLATAAHTFSLGYPSLILGTYIDQGTAVFVVGAGDRVEGERVLEDFGSGRVIECSVSRSNLAREEANAHAALQQYGGSYTIGFRPDMCLFAVIAEESTPSRQLQLSNDLGETLFRVSFVGPGAITDFGP